MQLLRKLERTIASLAFVMSFLHVCYVLVGSDEGARHAGRAFSLCFLVDQDVAAVSFCSSAAHKYTMYNSCTVFAIHSTANIMYGITEQGGLDHWPLL
jgi:hypothetical protein